MVLWAFTLAPLGLVAVLRAVSIIVAVVIGILLLNERTTIKAVVAVAFVFFGAVLIKGF